MLSRHGFDPVVVIGLAVLAAVHLRGRARPAARSSAATWRRRSTDAGLAAIAVALLGPVHHLAGDLAAAHMVQHVLLTVVAAPLLAIGLPEGTLIRGLPSRARRVVVRAGASDAVVRFRGAATRPVVVFLLHAGSLWVWHSAVLYDAAVAHPVVHAIEHAAFLGTGVLFWGVVVRAGSRRGVSEGTALLLVFTTALQSVLLSALLTFSPRPWYRSYLETAVHRSMDPLTDQQLAGLIMWVPAGLVYVAAALTLLVAWINSSNPAPSPAPAEL